MNKLFKLTPLILVFTLLFASIPFSSGFGAGAYLSGYGTENWGGAYFSVDRNHPTAESEWSSGGQSISLNASYYIGTFTVYQRIHRWLGTRNGTYYARIWNASGVVGTDCLPTTDNGYIAESMNYIKVDGVTTSTEIGWYDWQFDNVLLTAGNYTFTVDGVSECYTQCHIDLGFDTSSPTHEGNFVEYYSSAWHAFSNYDLIFHLTEYDAGDPTPTPTPAGTTGDDATNELISTFTDYLIPLIIFLLPAMILGWLTRWEKWPILIGLAIGSGLGYVFVPNFPVWLVFLVSLGIIGFAYSEVKRGS